MLISNDPGRSWVLNFTKPDSGFYGNVGVAPLAEWGSIPVSWALVETDSPTNNIDLFLEFTEPPLLQGKKFVRGLSGSFNQPEGVDGFYMRGGSLLPSEGMPPISDVSKAIFTFPLDTNVILSAPGSGYYTLAIGFFRETPLFIQSYLSEPFDIVTACEKPQNILATQVGPTYLLSWNGPVLTQISASIDGGLNFFIVEEHWEGSEYIVPSGFFQGAVPPIFRINGVCEYGLEYVTSVDVDITLQFPGRSGILPRRSRFRR